MTLEISGALNLAEIELCEDDIKKIGILDGAQSQLEITPVGRVDSSSRSNLSDATKDEPGHSYKKKMPARRAVRLDNGAPPYVVEKGWKFWKRRKV